MADLRTNVIKQYATYWKELGELLGVEDHDIVIITANNKYNPNQSVDSCYEMLCKWRNKNLSPTWGKLEDAVEKLSKRAQPFKLTDSGSIFALKYLRSL